MRAATTKNHWIGSLNDRNVLSHNSGGWKSEIQVLAGSLPSESWKGELTGASPRASEVLQTISGIA